MLKSLDDKSESEAGHGAKTSQPGGSQANESITLPVHEVKRRLRLLKVPVTCVLNLLLLYARPTVSRPPFARKYYCAPMLLISIWLRHTLAWHTSDYLVRLSLCATSECGKSKLRCIITLSFDVFVYWIHVWPVIQGVEDDQETQLDAAFATVCRLACYCMLHIACSWPIKFVFYAAKRVPEK